MTALQALAVLAGGLFAGTVNAIIGSGTLVTFPVLLGIGYAPITANVTNTVGLVPGSFSALYQLRDELRGRWRKALLLAAGTMAGAVVGAILLLTLPSSAFEAVVVVLIASALVLVVFQPRISAWVLRRREAREQTRPVGDAPALRGAIAATGVYGGYFGAAQGVILFALLGVALPDDIGLVNALRNLLAGTANLTAAIVFLIAANVRPGAAALLAAGSVLGGVLGARVAQRTPAGVLRGVVVVVGIIAIARVITG